MAITRDRMVKEWLMTGDIRPVECSRATLVTRDGQEIMAKIAHWPDTVCRYQKRAFVYVKGNTRTFFIDMGEFDIYQLIIESENVDQCQLSYYT
jgi:hypothetical protein